MPSSGGSGSGEREDRRKKRKKEKGKKEGRVHEKESVVRSGKFGGLRFAGLLIGKLKG